MGKKKEERYVIKKPEAPMSENQSYALYHMTGVSVQGTDLTKGQAHKLHSACNEGNCKTVRMALLELDGAEMKKREVHKNFRSEKNPTGYKVKAAAKKKAAPESEDDDLALTADAMKRLATEDPAQLIALLTGKPLVDPEPKPKSKTQPKNTNTPTARKRAAAAKAKTEATAKAKVEKEDVTGDVADQLGDLLKQLAG